MATFSLLSNTFKKCPLTSTVLRFQRKSV